MRAVMLGALLLIAPVAALNADTDPHGATPLHWAARADDLAEVTRLIRAGASVKAANRYGVTPLSLAAVNGSAAVVTALLDAGADPNSISGEGEPVLMSAARSGSVAAVMHASAARPAGRGVRAVTQRPAVRTLAGSLRKIRVSIGS